MKQSQPRLYAGLDLGGTYLKCGMFDDRGVLLGKTAVPTKRERPYSEVLKDAAAAVLRLAEECANNATLTAVGVGAPGTVDGARGVIVYSNNLAWADVPVGECLEGLLRCPVRVLNDANAAALGESVCGAGRGYENVVLLTLGTGVGSGIVLNGTIYAGKCSAGAEIGHTTVRRVGMRCTCGRRGCLEAYASASALLRRARAGMTRDPKSRLWSLCHGTPEALDGKLFFEGVRAGDGTAASVLKHYLGDLAAGIVNVANVFRPDIILLGGGICAEKDLLLPPLRRILDKEIFGGNRRANVELDVAELGNDAGLYGAVAYVRTSLDITKNGGRL